MLMSKNVNNNVRKDSPTGNSTLEMLLKTFKEPYNYLGTELRINALVLFALYFSHAAACLMLALQKVYRISAVDHCAA